MRPDFISSWHYINNLLTYLLTFLQFTDRTERLVRLYKHCEISDHHYVVKCCYTVCTLYIPFYVCLG